MGTLVSLYIVTSVSVGAIVSGLGIFYSKSNRLLHAVPFVYTVLSYAVQCSLDHTYRFRWHVALILGLALYIIGWSMAMKAKLDERYGGWYDARRRSKNDGGSPRA